MKRIMTTVVMTLILLAACHPAKVPGSVSIVQSSPPQQFNDTLLAISKPPAELTGRWNFTKMPNDAAKPVFTKEFLVFDPVEMRVSGKASCNGFFANYTVDTISSKKEIHFAAIGHTMMACENLATENKMLGAMEKVTSWSREGDKLYLKADGITLIELTRAAEGVM